MKYLVAFGCSHTNGSMLDGVNGSSEYNVRNGFPGILAKRHGYELINISKPGGSNQYIHRSVVEFLTHYHNENDDYLFLINWTSRPRMELRYHEDSNCAHVTVGDYTDKKSVPFTIGTNASLFADKSVIKLLSYSPYFINLDVQAERWACWVYGLQQLLQAKNIKYFMSNTCEPLPQIAENISVVNQLNLQTYMEPFDTQNCMIEFLMDQNFEKTSCWHFRKDGHEAWADKLELRLRKLRYVE